ncbi:hypothetical protein P886_2025 [Alteromonadaceae bacterium 2753L.S.0a.02]|nr:hypothetical protein P886_2025 [Alteromonadaceae bacterium 2753L.S.0a.02]
MRNTLRLPPAEGVSAGTTATVRLTGPRCYHDVTVQTNFPFAQINAIRIVANNRTVQEYTGEALNAFNKFDDLQATDDTFFTVYFDQSGLKQRAHEEMTAFNVGSTNPKDGSILADLELQFDIDAAATNPSVVNSWATVSPVKAGGPGAIRSIYRLPGTAGVSGRWDFDKLPKRTRGAQFLSRLFIKAANITEIELQRDMRTNWERTAALNTRLQGDSDRNPQAGWFVIDFTEDGYGENRLDVRTVNDLRLKVTSSGAETVEMFAEYIGELEI